MDKSKQIQLDEDLFLKMYQYFKCERIDLYEEIAKGIEDKMDRLIAHSYYTTSLTETDEVKKEEARLAYLDYKGMLESFRY